MGERMSIGLDEVLHVAKLAELAVKESEFRRLVEQMNRIVNYVAMLDEVPADRIAELFLAGPPSVTLREDVEGGAVPLARPVAAMAPEFREGFFLVPRHGAMEDQ
jgi:aspartyl/glutamyl-tRNA(Asn/Gln) amidotransferase C subunit